MPYTLPQAAVAVARDRSTILRMIKAGKLSATRDPANNGWLIEPAELHRMYFERLPKGTTPAAYIASANLRRRNLTKGQQAMATAMIYPAPAKGGRGNFARSGTAQNQRRRSEQT
jgi:hypothetical protein